MLGGGAAPEGNHLCIGLHHPPGADTTRCKREANFQCWHACSTCHDGLLAVVTSASQGAVLSGAVPPETRHHSQVVVVSVEYSSRTLPRCWQLCRKCNNAPLWRTAICVVIPPIFYISGFQYLSDDIEQSCVINLPFQQSHKSIMVDVVKGFDNLLPLSTTHLLTPQRS
jgi:hypothetical protein